jgi:Outer membrane lipoprotein-sorting protein
MQQDFPRMAFSIRTKLLLFIAIFFIPVVAQAMTASEILERVAKENFGDTFRIPLTVKTFKSGRLKSNHTLWLMGRTKDHSTSIFIEFDTPKESKGLRFLFEMLGDKEPKAFMYLPATHKTLPLDMNDPATDIGGTGLSMEDIQGFIPQKGEQDTLLKEKKADGRECYVIRVELPGGKGDRMLWVSKKDFFVVKSHVTDPHGKIKKTFRVVEFFKTEKGKEFPREEEINIPGKHIKIRLRQDSAVFGVDLPDEVMDPEKFGTFKWRD